MAIVQDGEYFYAATRQSLWYTTLPSLSERRRQASPVRGMPEMGYITGCQRQSDDMPANCDSEERSLTSLPQQWSYAQYMIVSAIPTRSWLQRHKWQKLAVRRRLQTGYLLLSML